MPRKGSWLRAVTRPRTLVSCDRGSPPQRCQAERADGRDMNRAPNHCDRPRKSDRSTFVASLCVLLLAASGCASTTGLRTTEPREAVESAVFAVRWSRNLMPDVPSYRERANPLQGSTPAIDREGHRVFVGSADHHMYCIRAGTGEVLWRRDTGAEVRSMPLFMPDTQVIFFGTDDGELWAVGAEDGERRWVFDADAEINHQPVLSGEALYITAANNNVHALDWTNGESIWNYEQEPSSSEFEVGGFAGPVVNDGVLYTGFSNGTVVALDAYDGDEIWERNLAADLSADSGIGGLPVLADADATPLVGSAYVFVSSYDAGIFALDRTSGNIVWHEPLRGVYQISGQGNTVFAAQAGFGIVAFDADDGSIRWRRRLGPATYYRPRVFRDLLIVADSERGLSALRLENGEIVQRYTVGSGAGGMATIVGSTAFVLSNGGVLAALRIR